MEKCMSAAAISITVLAEDHEEIKFNSARIPCAMMMEKEHNNLAEPPFVSISMPSSPISQKEGSKSTTKEHFPEAVQTKAARFHPQPSLHVSTSAKNIPLRDERIDRDDDRSFESFRTRPGTFQRQLSNFRGRPCEIEEDVEAPESLPVERFFDALEGPELDTLRPTEEAVLPKDKKWPFLLRFPISSFGMCLGVGSQAIMWKTLAASSSSRYLHVSPVINLVIWCIAVVLVILVASTYTLKILLYFEAVRREFSHPIRANFFFAPWIAFLFLCLGLPPLISRSLPSFIWYVLMTPFFCLELKIYGEWMSGGDRRLSKIANPSNHLAVVGNFVGALLGASMGLKEGPIFFFAVGLAHYTVLFVTLYQRLPTTETLPKELHPVFFLFVAAPSVASTAWARITGNFGYGSQIAYFIALFLYFSLAVRVNFFRGFKFSLAWWAYTFPMTGAAIATVTYADAAPSLVTKALALTLCTVATLTVAALLVTTIIHAFILRRLFPNDMAIAISNKRPKARRWPRKLIWNADSIIEQYLKFSDAAEKLAVAGGDPCSAKRTGLPAGSGEGVDARP